MQGRLCVIASLVVCECFKQSSLCTLCVNASSSPGGVNASSSPACALLCLSKQFLQLLARVHGLFSMLVQYASQKRRASCRRARPASYFPLQLPVPMCMPHAVVCFKKEMACTNAGQVAGGKDHHACGRPHKKGHEPKHAGLLPQVCSLLLSSHIHTHIRILLSHICYYLLMSSAKIGTSNLCSLTQSLL
jgi:hypothetical protein